MMSSSSSSSAIYLTTKSCTKPHSHHNSTKRCFSIFTMMMFMDWDRCFIIFLASLSLNVVAAQDENVPFWQNYGLPWGTSHVQVLDNNTQVQLSLDQYTGSAGFKSLQTYGSGWFSMKIKMPQKDSTGVITTFYLHSEKEKWDEIDFELLGGNGKEKPYVVHTNLITNGEGGREQRFHLWFDPTADFHNYTLLWNSHQLMWFVDGKPVRVFKNIKGGSFPREGLSIRGTIWNGTWAGAPVNWNDGPFVASYRGFGVKACPTRSADDPQCKDSSKYWWNQLKYWSLDSLQKQMYHDVRSKFMVYDYCDHNPPHPDECHVDP